MQDLHTKFNALQRSQERIIPLLQSGASTPDWTPGEDRWSFRAIAAHLAATERECFLKRVHQFQTEKHPRFTYYHNSQRDFSGHEIEEDLAAWQQARQNVIAAARSLDKDQRAKVALHERMGEMNVIGLLDLILDHDQNHYLELKENLQLRDQA